MSKNNFTRTNVDVRSLEVSAPKRSSFDLTKNDAFSLRFGKLIPLRCEKLIPGDTLKGSLKPKLQLEKFATPAAGRMRLDSHSFVVSARRIHNQYRQWSESILHGGASQTLPSFSVFDLARLFLDVIVQGTYYGDDVPDFNQFLRLVGINHIYTTYSYQAYCLMVIRGVIDVDRSGIWNFKTHGNHDDFLAEYFEYLEDWLKINEPDSHGVYPNPNLGLADVIYALLKPLFGEESTLDNLGYPIVSYYSTFMQGLRSVFDSTIWEIRVPEVAEAIAEARQVQVDDQLKVEVFADTFNHFTDNILNIDPAEAESIIDGADSYIKLVESEYKSPNVDEMPLRAVYSVWYDYFRNYHVEPSTSCLNPDNFGSDALLDTTENPDVIKYNLIELLAPRCRNWSRDMFTMVQPDDVYRHVYAPAPASTLKATMTDLNDNIPYQNADSGFAALFDEIKEGLNNQVLHGFPSWATNLFGDEKSISVYYHDLQTMRRANMLEKFLQRNYYNPDTYVGQIEARFGIKPVDFSILTCQYIGGSESMINGEQTISPVDTGATAAGQRTLVSNASLSDSFSYTTSDAAFLVNFVSIMPLVHYNVLNPHLQELKVSDQIIPEYAQDNRVITRACDLLRGLNDSYADELSMRTPLGFVPRYYGYRAALDGVHGKYLREYRSYVWLRDYYSQGRSLFTINPINNRVHIPLDCFLGLKSWDSIAFGEIEMPLFIERSLPAKVEFV